jgi:hypothetical protein
VGNGYRTDVNALTTDMVETGSQIRPNQYIQFEIHIAAAEAEAISKTVCSV